MSDDTTTPATDTVDTSAPEEGHAPAGETTDYEKRYNDLRSEFDRRNQTLSEYEQTFQGLSDPETRAEILAQFGLEVEDDEEELDTPEYEDPYETLPTVGPSRNREAAGRRGRLRSRPGRTPCPTSSSLRWRNFRRARARNSPISSGG
jgi:hypothetical protein